MLLWVRRPPARRWCEASRVTPRALLNKTKLCYKLMSRETAEAVEARATSAI